MLADNWVAPAHLMSAVGRKSRHRSDSSAFGRTDAGRYRGTIACRVVTQRIALTGSEVHSILREAGDYLSKYAVAQRTAGHRQLLSLSPYFDKSA
jgi:hypothetical protein